MGAETTSTAEVAAAEPTGSTPVVTPAAPPPTEPPGLAPTIAAVRTDVTASTEPASAAPAAAQAAVPEAGDAMADLGGLALERDAGLIGANREIDPGSSRIGWLGAVAGHLAVAGAILFAPPPEGYWSGGSDGDGIDVEIVSGRPTADVETTLARAEQAESLSRLVEPPPAPSPPVAAALTPPDAIDPDEVLPQPAAVPPKPVAVAEAAPTRAPEPQPRAEPRLDQPASAADAESSKGARDRLAASQTGAQRLGASSPVTLRASPGEISAYSRLVTETLDRSKPRTTLGLKGTVSISFSIDEQGGIERAFVDRSSGSPRLDGLALDALKAVRLPAPPPGLTADQRLYRIPITFQ